MLSRDKLIGLILFLNKNMKCFFHRLAHGRRTIVRPGSCAILTCKSRICRLRLFSRSLIKMFNILIKDQYDKSEVLETEKPFDT